MNDLCIEILAVLNFKVWDDKIKLGMIRAKVERAYEREAEQELAKAARHNEADA